MHAPEQTLIARPSPAALKACLQWWKSLTPAEQEIFAGAELDPIRWWTTTAKHGSEFHWEFEHVTINGGMEVWGWVKRGKKSWGPLQSIRPITADEQSDSYFVEVQHKETSPFYQRKRQRDWMKSKLPGRYRKYVNMARSNSKATFLAETVGGTIRRKPHPSSLATNKNCQMTADGKWIIHHEPGRCHELPEIVRERLGMNLEDFWRCSQGKTLVSKERMQPQKTLFDL